MKRPKPIVTLEEEIPDSQSRILIKVCNEIFIKTMWGDGI